MQRYGPALRAAVAPPHIGRTCLRAGSRRAPAAPPLAPALSRLLSYQAHITRSFPKPQQQQTTTPSSILLVRRQLIIPPAASIRRPFTTATKPTDTSTRPTSPAREPTSSAMNVSCQCGTVSFATPAPAPLAVYHCHCRECQKQSASAFGTSAIFPAAGLFPLPADLAAQLAVYRRPGARAKSGREMDCYFCKTCGCRVMHRILGEDGTPRDTVSVKGGLVEGLEWKGARHIYTRSAVVEIPEGSEKFPGTPPR